MHRFPLVSIIIPVFNAERYLRETINSALAQTWPAIEILIIDDGSTDNSFEIANEFTNANIKVFIQGNKGASAARNYGLKYAKGDYIQFLDADDLLSTDKIELQMTVLNNNCDLIALCDTAYFDDGTEPYQSKSIKEWYNADWDDPVDFLLKLYMGSEIMAGYGGMIQTNSWLTPRQLIDKAGLWNEFKCPDDDGEFFCRVILASKGLRYAKGINYYRKYNSGTSLSGQKTREALQNSLRAVDLKYNYLKARTIMQLLTGYLQSIIGTLA